jgi:hypothetical protein
VRPGNIRSVGPPNLDCTSDSVRAALCLYSNRPGNHSTGPALLAQTTGAW